MTQSIVPEPTIAKTIADYFTALSNLDLAAWIVTFAENATMYDPVTAPPFCGHEGISQFFLAIAPMLANLEIAPEFLHVVGNEVAVKWLGRSVSQDGREIRFEGIDLFEVDDVGKIQTLRAYWDGGSFLAKLQG